MQFQFSFKQMETSEALQTYAEAKIREKIQKFVTKAIEAHVFFSVTRHTQTVHVSLRAGDGFGIEVENSSEDMYATIDGLVDKLAVQLKKHKEKLKDHKQPRIAQSLLDIEPEQVEDAVDAADIVKFETGKRRASAR